MLRLFVLVGACCGTVTVGYVMQVDPLAQTLLTFFGATIGMSLLLREEES